MNQLLIVTIALALPLAAGAQTIWRCGPDGRSYSATPCAEGRSLEALQPRPVDDLAEAQNRAARERRDADAMTKERLAQEARQRGSGLAAIAPPAAVKPVASAASAVHHRAPRIRQPGALAAAGTWPSAAP